MVEHSTHRPESLSGTDPLAALEQVQRELDELAAAMNECQSDIDQAARQPEELAKQKAELFDRFQREHVESECRRKQLEELETKLRQKQTTLDRLQKQMESRERAANPPPMPDPLKRVTPMRRSRKPMFMRLVVDLVVLLAILAGGAGYWWTQHQQVAMRRQIDQVRQSMREIHNVAMLHGGQGDVPVHTSGYPLKIEATWFATPPVNGLAADHALWLAVAEPERYAATNPRNITVSDQRAAFWYNPARGIIRARVPRQITEDATMDLYNRINATSLSRDDVNWGNSQQP